MGTELFYVETQPMGYIDKNLFFGTYTVVPGTSVQTGVRNYGPPGLRHERRGYISYDTSGIPDTAEIVSAEFTFSTGTIVTVGSPGSITIFAYIGNDELGVSLDSSDWDWPDSFDEPFFMVQSNTAYTGTVNASNLDEISLDARTNFALRPYGNYPVGTGFYVPWVLGRCALEVTYKLAPKVAYNFGG